MIASGAVLRLLVALPVPIQARTQPAMAIEGVTIVSLDSGPLLFDHTVLVLNGRIARVGPRQTVAVPAGATLIDGQGKYLMPGLADMHAHITARDFPLFLANGVTTVREMNGSPQHLAWRDSVRQGRLPGPSLVVASPLLAGVPQRYRHQLLTTPAEAVALVRSAQGLGYDAIKVYDGLSVETYQALAAEARRAGLPLTGHVPDAVGLVGVVQQGQRSIEHTQEILKRLDGHPPDSAAIVTAVGRLVGHGVWVTPTLAVFERLSLAGSAEVQSRFDRPEMALVDSATFAWWLSFRRPGAGAASPRAQQLADAHRLVVRELARRGVPILVGTDTPNPFMVPGFSLHDELEALTGAGWSRVSVLRAATRGAAEFLGRSGEFGSIAPGLRADLVLLDGDPLQDLSLLRRPAGVVVGGRWLARDTLDRMLEAARR
ncbi:MAG TPA: amidohydrolase family protein [Gemmatimonadales bacterium]